MFDIPKSGLYAITPEGKTPHEILKFTAAVLKGGASMVQYRFKAPCPSKEGKQLPLTVSPPLKGEAVAERRLGDVLFARELLTLCHSYNVPLIINDNVELAETIGADGVHLGKDDSSILQARVRLGKRAIIGVSCYNDLERALKAQKQGASYIAFGRFFTSNSKPLAQSAQIGTLTAGKKFLTVPIVAIGGILPENGAILLNAGADLLAVIGGLDTENPQLAAQKFAALFTQNGH